MSWKDDKNKRADAVVRVSSKGQRDNSSHEIQEAEIRAYCEQHGLQLVKIFTLTESAKKSIDRRQYRAALNHALGEGVRHLLFYMQDRESRNLRDLEDNEQHVKDGKLIIHYVHDRKVLDQTTTESDFFNRDIQGAMNKNYSRVLAAKVKDAQRVKAENGWFPGGRLPLGYVHLRPKDGNGKEIKRASTTVVVDPNLAVIRLLRREFELKAKNYSLDKIMETTLAEGLVPKSEVKHYTRVGIDWRLHNKFYWGRFDWDGVEYQGKHPLIIPEELLEAVAMGFERKGRGGVHSLEDAPFSGLLRCANSDCGCQITYERKVKPMSTGEAKVYNLYRCSNSKKVHKNLKGMYVTEDSLWAQAEQTVSTFSLTKELAEEIAAALNELEEKAIAANRREAETFDKILLDLDQRNHALFDMLMKRTISEDEYRRQLSRIEAERFEVSRQLAEANVGITGAVMKAAKDVFELATGASSLWKEQGKAERLVFLKKVCSNQVLDGQTLRYEMKKPFTLLAEMKGLQDWSTEPDTGRTTLSSATLLRLWHAPRVPIQPY